ncbi:MAG: lyase family protein, partial [Clostridiaceae bacterium]
MDYRLEQDLLGGKNIDNCTYSGINTARALENFDLNGKTVNLNLIKEIALIKKAAAMTNKSLKLLAPEKADAIIKASEEVMEGKFHNEFKIS